MKQQKAIGLLSSSGIKTLLSEITLVVPLLFEEFEMNEIVNKFWLPGDKFIPEMCLRQTGFTYSACGTFAKNKERIQKFKETGDTRYRYQNKLDKAIFFNMTWLMEISMN